MERWTVEDFNNGVTKAQTSKGEVVTVYEVTDRLLTCQGIRFRYERLSGWGRGRTTTFVNNDGKMLADHDTVLDLFKID